MTEARDPLGGFYPLLDRAGELLPGPEPAEGLHRLGEDIGRHTRAVSGDDSALLLLDFLGASPIKPDT
nr:hypothetical protein [Mangrovactinospora gilvigrisea]